MTERKRARADQIESVFKRINDTISVAHMTCCRANSVEAARRILEARNRIDKRIAELDSGAAPSDWKAWLEEIKVLLYPG